MQGLTLDMPTPLSVTEMRRYSLEGKTDSTNFIARMLPRDPRAEVSALLAEVVSGEG